MDAFDRSQSPDGDFFVSGLGACNLFSRAIGGHSPLTGIFLFPGETFVPPPVDPALSQSPDGDFFVSGQC